MPFSHALQWSAILALDRGADITYQKRILEAWKERQIEAILNG